METTHKDKLSKKETKKPKRIPDKLINLANNIYYIQLRLWREKYSNSNNKIMDNSIEEMSLKHAGMVIDIIMKAAKELDSKDKKEAFYELIGNNHMIIAEVYTHNRHFFNSAINKLCEKECLAELDAKMTSNDAMFKLCELTESKECSRLQRVFDILMKHGDNLTTVDKNGIKQSNASKLGISKDDIKSLQLLAKTDKWGKFDFLEFLIFPIYLSIRTRKKNGAPKFNFIIYDLYDIILDMAILEENIDIETYKKKNIERIKRYLNDLKNKDRVVIRFKNKDSKIYNAITQNKKLEDIKFKTNVVDNYFKSAKSLVSIIRGKSSRTTNEEAQTSNSASSSQHEQKSNEIIQDVIDTSSLKEEDITSLSVASPFSHKTNEEVITDFLNNSNLSILLTAMSISLIILSILSYTKMKQTI
ncbi:hypothetical protein NEIG_02444 [Nematocida sp. ERTm5]|nr:hypothetical protein NEIG_02444 [Nematocida sp. ERTm5]